GRSHSAGAEKTAPHNRIKTLFPFPPVFFTVFYGLYRVYCLTFGANGYILLGKQNYFKKITKSI
ncbi:MAG: hypothetical protein J6C40_00260, partial [Lentisphaeria bacterium]|nr:hypothetical protein [Lentisphaeria bacterium]